MNSVSEITQNKTQEVLLNLEEVLISNKNIDKLLNFFQKEVGGNIFLKSNIESNKLIQVCRNELFRNNPTTINPISTSIKRGLQSLIGEFLFENLPYDKQGEIINAILSREGGQVHIQLDVNDIKDKEKLFFPWEYMQCSTEWVRQFNSAYKDTIWLSGEEDKTLFYRVTKNGNVFPKSYASVNVLIVDATEEQKFYNYFNPGVNNIEEQKKKKLELFSNMKFIVLGKEDGNNRAVYSNIVSTVTLSQPEIIHLIVDSFSSKNDELNLGLLEPGSSGSETVDQDFGETIILKGVYNKWLLHPKKQPSVFILQEWKGKKQAKYETLEEIAFLFSKNEIPATIVIPYQQGFNNVTDYLTPLYKSLSERNSVGNAILKLRLSFIYTQSLNLPILYLNNRDFILIEESNNNNKEVDNKYKESGNKNISNKNEKEGLAVDSEYHEFVNETILPKYLQLKNLIKIRELSSGPEAATIETSIELQRIRINNDYKTHASHFDRWAKGNFLEFIKKIDSGFESNAMS